MGRYLLLIVLAAAVGGSVLAVGTRGTLGASARHASEGQADVLAREIAAAGQSAALSHMMAGDGLEDPTRKLGEAQDYQGGRFQIAYAPGATEREATVRVTGTYGGAIHTIESDYAYNPMDAPGPVWLDVPYATVTGSTRGEIDGGKAGKPVQFDRRKFDELGLDEIMDLDDLDTDLAPDVRAMGAALEVPVAERWTGELGLLNHLNVEDAEGLYQKAARAFDPAAGDRSFDGPQVLTSRLRFSGGDDDGVLMYNDGLRIANGGRLQGEGVLIVNGPLVVAADDPATRFVDEEGRLDWKGIVMVRTTEQVLPIELKGKVDLKGMVVVNHLAYAPGGHLDVSVYRDATGMTEDHPEGDLSEQVGWGSRYPWHQHTHAFDIKPASAPRGDHVYFLEGGGPGRHEYQVQFESLLAKLGDERVFLEIAHPENDGFSLVNLHVTGRDGTSGRLATTVERGFGEFAQADTRHATRAFPADRLQAFDVDVQSLRALQRAFDDDSCASWPRCIGGDWGRRGSMAFRLRRASDNARLYEATLYWHMRTDEADAHADEEAEWRDRIRSGEAFGTQLELGDDVTIEFDVKPIDALSDRLDFDGDSIVLVATRSSHQTSAETAAAGIAPYRGDVHSGATRSGRTGRLRVCLAGQTLEVTAGELDVYLALGASEGTCGSGGGGSGGRAPLTTVCHSGSTTQVATVDLLVHLSHGDRLGACGDDDGDDD